MEKVGFVYIWYDRKHKRYYIGSHWGHVNDGYVCSSNWMRDAYKKRTDDFKRRIVSTVTTNRNDLLIEEQKWLNLIKDHELRTRYYNLTKRLISNWSTSDEKRKTVGQKISAGRKRPETSARISHQMKTNNPMHMPGVAQKIGLKNRGRKPWNYGLTADDPRVKKNGVGHSEKMLGKAPSNKGGKLYHDPITGKTKFIVGDVIPDGFILGRKK